MNLFLHSGKSHALNGRSDSIPRILTFTTLTHCSYLDIYISQNIGLCKGDFEGQFSNQPAGQRYQFFDPYKAWYFVKCKCKNSYLQCDSGNECCLYRLHLLIFMSVYRGYHKFADSSKCINWFIWLKNCIMVKFTFVSYPHLFWS